MLNLQKQGAHNSRVGTWALGFLLSPAGHPGRDGASGRLSVLAAGGCTLRLLSVRLILKC